jgi:hypothetical protein
MTQSQQEGKREDRNLEAHYSYTQNTTREINIIPDVSSGIDGHTWGARGIRTNHQGEVDDCIKVLPENIKVVLGKVKSEENAGDIASRTDARSMNLTTQQNQFLKW